MRMDATEGFCRVCRKVLEASRFVRGPSGYLKRICINCGDTTARCSTCKKRIAIECFELVKGLRMKTCDPCRRSKWQGKSLGAHLRQISATRVRDAIGMAGRAGRSTEEIIGCSIDELRRHIEGQFCTGMSWDNHGVRGWHIDHIVPLKAPGINGGEPTLEEIRSRLHWTNTQPLWAFDNISKGNKLVGIRATDRLSDEDLDAILGEL